ncbi:hypothetical protein BDW62DRAFT_196971 [Aspergillus aurantiobrunneus]
MTSENDYKGPFIVHSTKPKEDAEPSTERKASDQEYTGSLIVHSTKPKDKTESAAQKASDEEYTGPFIVHPTKPHTDPNEFLLNQPFVPPPMPEAPIADMPGMFPMPTMSDMPIMSDPPMPDMPGGFPMPPMPSMPSMPVITPISDEPGTFEVLLGISPRIEELNHTDWTIILHKTDHEAHICRTYSILYGPKDGAETGYGKFCHANTPYSPPEDTSIFEKRILLGTLEEENLHRFEEVFFFEMSPGPNNYFVLRLLRKLTHMGLLCEHDVGEALSREVMPCYNKAEYDYFGGYYTESDSNYVRGEVEDNPAYQEPVVNLEIM